MPSGPVQRGPRPTGRVELLAWLNDICGTHYPSVETLRDGLGYLSLVEATIARTEEMLEDDGDDRGDAQQHHHERLPRRAVVARNIIQKADLDVTERLLPASSSSHGLGAAPVDPSQDSIQVRERCERNFHLLQEMLRKCLDREHGVELDVKRLASGKLQEHMRLLQWSVGFVSSRFAAAKRRVASLATDATTTTTPRGGGGGPHQDHRGRQQARSNSAASASKRLPSTPRGAAAVAATSALSASGSARQEAIAGVGRRTQSSTAGRRASLGELPQHSHPPMTTTNNPSTAASDYDPSRYHQHPLAGHHLSGGDLPSSVSSSIEHPELAALARELAELEAEVWRRGPVAGGGEAQHMSGDKHSTHNEHGDCAASRHVNDLTLIRDLLRERDVLWQTLVAVEAAVWRDAATATATTAAAAGDTPRQSQLLCDLCAVFHVNR